MVNRNLLTVNHQQEQGLLARDSDLIQARNALVLALAEMVGQRDAETGAHLMRLRHILQKPGRLSDDERLIMQKHTIIAATTLQKVAEAQGFSLAFFQMAIEIARHHHERFDGTGYPDRLAGEGIPLSARIVAIADVYDALRSNSRLKRFVSGHQPPG